MDREIKYRIWRKDLKRYLDFTELYRLKINPLFSLVYSANTGIGADICPQVFQQFTGLSDKNGKEIFEGDIIQQLEFEDWGDDQGTITRHVIQWRQFEYYGHYECGWYAGYCKIYKECEVVGNIFENPELIT